MRCLENLLFNVLRWMLEIMLHIVKKLIFPKIALQLANHKMRKLFAVVSLQLMENGGLNICKHHTLEKIKAKILNQPLPVNLPTLALLVFGKQIGDDHFYALAYQARQTPPDKLGHSTCGLMRRQKSYATAWHLGVAF